ncbi:MAG: sulfite exporter TauE/SafE family protein [Acidimicrobiia bacterium]|nr:sulfite exporter TauE/SafE family protein [Acidimicrobiia bacterium]
MTELGLFVLGLVAGTTAVVIGLGGGVIYVPALTALFGFAQKDASGTSLAVIAPAALIATIANGRAGRVAWRVAIGVAAGALVGAIAGSQVAQSLDDKVLRRMFAVLLIFTAIRMLRQLRAL